MTSTNSVVVFDELAASDRLRVWWGFLWRGFLTTIASMVGGGLIGFGMVFLFGLILHASGLSVESLRTGGSVLGGVAGLAMGLILFWQYIRWLFRAKWSGYQLRLVRSDNNRERRD